jgi:hypothetical protein
MKLISWIFQTTIFQNVELIQTAPDSEAKLYSSVHSTFIISHKHSL